MPFGIGCDDIRVIAGTLMDTLSFALLALLAFLGLLHMRHQAPLALHLAASQLVAPVGKRILPGLELDAHGGTH